MRHFYSWLRDRNGSSWEVGCAFLAMPCMRRRSGDAEGLNWGLSLS